MKLIFWTQIKVKFLSRNSLDKFLSGGTELAVNIINEERKILGKRFYFFQNHSWSLPLFKGHYGAASVNNAIETSITNLLNKSTTQQLHTYMIKHSHTHTHTHTRTHTHTHIYIYIYIYMLRMNFIGDKILYIYIYIYSIYTYIKTNRPTYLPTTLARLLPS